MARLGRIALFLAISGALIALGGRRFGPLIGGVIFGWWLLSRSILPRSAHRAFVAGNMPRARLYYRILRWLHGRDSQTSVWISLAACAAGSGDYRQAMSLLERVDPDKLGESARAVWSNNRGYALARADADAAEALARADEALRLRPSTAPFHHTRATALLGLGRVDEAIAELESAWCNEGKEETLFEAERCYDLGRAWTARGESEYGSEYFARAYRLAPLSVWGQRAAERLPTTRIPTFDREL